MKKNTIRIKLKSYNHKALDLSVSNIIDTAKRTGATVRGPIPLPTKIEKYTVLRSPHVDKKSREQFELLTHKRLIMITNATAQTVDSLKGAKIGAGIHITVSASA